MWRVEGKSWDELPQPYVREMLRGSLWRSGPWRIPRSLLDACQLRYVPAEAARECHQMLEVGLRHLSAWEQAPKPSAELTAQLFAFMAHVHSSHANMVPRYASLEAITLPDDEWLAQAERWRPKPRKVSRPATWKYDELARSMYAAFEAYVQHMDRHYEWHAISRRRPDNKPPAGSRQIPWNPRTQKGLIRDFCAFQGLDARQRRWLCEPSPRGRFMCNYFAEMFRKRLLRDTEDDVLRLATRWVTGYSKQSE